VVAHKRNSGASGESEAARRVTGGVMNDKVHQAVLTPSKVCRADGGLAGCALIAGRRIALLEWSAAQPRQQAWSQ